jgi:hypothetical protein
MAEKIVRFGSDTCAEWPLCRMALVKFLFCAIAITKSERAIASNLECAIAQNNSHAQKNVLQKSFILQTLKVSAKCHLARINTYDSKT